jgi:putative DNA primase/helicase
LAYAPADNAAGREVAIETRGNGGYAVIPPSFCPQAVKHGIPHKQPYRAIQGDFTQIPTIPPEDAQRLLEAARSLCQAPRSKQQMQAAPLSPRSNGEPSGSGVIGRFNEVYGVGAILARNGYEQHGNRYLAPDSTTREPGVFIFEDTGRCFSHHGNDILNDGHAHDAFSVFCMLEHGGDVKVAVKAAAEILGVERPRTSAPKASEKQAAQKPGRLEAHPSVPRWPHEVMGGAAGNFSKAYSAYLETPQAFLFMAYLTFLGHIISGRITLCSEISPEPRLYVGLLGESADDRKTTSISKTQSFFRSVISTTALSIINYEWTPTTRTETKKEKNHTL